jgi:hypothetical protein
MIVQVVGGQHDAQESHFYYGAYFPIATRFLPEMQV